MTQTQRTERFEARLTPEQKQTLEAAAALRGQKLSEFVVSLAYQEAQRLLSEERLLKVSARDMDALLEALDSPPLPSPKLEAALKRRAELLGH